MTLRRKAINFEDHFGQLIEMLNGIFSFSTKQKQIAGMTMYQYPFLLSILKISERPCCSILP
jgi:hypothetical protein